MTLFLLFILSVGVVFVLYILSIKLSNRQNSFIRRFPSHVLSESCILDIKYNSYYISGLSNHNIYLANYLSPDDLLISNKTLTDTHYVRIKKSGKTTFQDCQMRVDSPSFFIADIRFSNLLKGALTDFTAWRLTTPKVNFVDAEPLGNTTFLLRIIDDHSHQYTLVKVGVNTKVLIPKINLLEKQIDGIFCSDGILNCDFGTDRIVYVYYYRNQFICADTNLNLLYRGRTIDTNTTAKIKLATIASENKITLAEPPLYVNKMSCISGNKLFVISNLLATNEDRSNFNKSSVIDVYDLRQGKYQFSFYLPNHNKQKARDFRIRNDVLFALYDHYLIKYLIETKYLRS